MTPQERQEIAELLRQSKALREEIAEVRADMQKQMTERHILRMELAAIQALVDEERGA